MMACHEVDYGAHHQISILHLLRNGFAKGFATITVEQFKKIPLVVNKDPWFCEIKDESIFEFYRKLNNKGKKMEDKKKKKKSELETELSSRTLHLNNVNDYKDDLEGFKTNEFLIESREKELIKCFSGFDVTFLLNLLTNQILDYPLSKDIFDMLTSVKRIRNHVFHCGKKSNYVEFQEKFQELCLLLKNLYDFLNWETSELKDKIKEAKAEFNFRNPQRILESMRKELKEQEMEKYDSEKVNSYVAVPIKEAREGNSVEDFEQFLKTVKQPVVLCGSSGSGKSTVLQRLTQKYYCEENCMKYDLVISLDSPKRFVPHLSCRDIIDMIKRLIYGSCPKSFKEHTIDLCLFTLMNYGDLLFLVNSNVDSDGIRNIDKLRGQWVFCSNNSQSDWSSDYCVLKIEPLDEISVKEMLKTLISNSEYQDVNSLYDGCEYKSFISSPDMVIVLSEVVKQKLVFDQKCIHLLLDSFLKKQISPIENGNAHCKLLEKITFNFIMNNKMEYSDKDLSGISGELRSLLFIRQKNSYVFQRGIIEDFLAAKYVVANPETLSKKCVSQAPLFKRVFKFACAILNGNNELQNNLDHLKSYLEKCMDVKSPRSGKSEKIRITDEDFSNRGTFTKWSFLISLAEYCNFQEDMMELISSLLAQKYTWLIKCKLMEDERKIKAFHRILENVKLTKRIIIRIESGVQRKAIGYVLDVLSSIPGLCYFATIQIAIMHKQTMPVPSDSNISKLPSKITQINEPLFITKYEGPLLCSDIPDFLMCKCMSRLEILDVTVYDAASLAQALSCESLLNLKNVVIKVELRLSEGECISLPNLRFPSLPSVSFDIYIRYFDKFNEFLKSFEGKAHLRALTIQGMRMKENYFLDLSDFKALEALYINFNPHNASLANNNEGNTSLSKPFQFLMKSKLPETLQRLSLRGAWFWNDSYIYLLTKFSTQRLILLDSSVSVSGLRSILKEHISAGNLEDSADNLVDGMKRHCIMEEETNNMKDVIRKKPRLSKLEREMRRKVKPTGKELIITSNLKMCKDVSCCCNHLDSEHKDKLEDVIRLIYDAYFYDILSLSYTSEFITIRKDLCGDLRVRCPLTDLTDDIMDRYECDKQVARVTKSFLEILSLAQSITLDYTKLTLTGVEKVIGKFIELKRNVCADEEPFSLAISSIEYCVVADEVKNSKFLKFLVSENYLKQFKFFHCDSKSKYIRKTTKNEIFIDNELVEVN